MNGQRLTLEQFCVALRGQGTETERWPGDDRLPEGGLPGEAQVAGVGAGNGPGELALMDGPPIRRVRVTEPDDAALEAAERRDELAQSCARLADVIASIETDRAASIDAAIADLANSIATVGGELLSSVIDQTARVEIASAIVELAARLPHPVADLHVAADDHEAIAAAIAANAPEATITVISDPALGSGRARMIWPDGGAEFDAARLMDRIAPLIAEHMNGLNTRSVP